MRYFKIIFFIFLVFSYHNTSFSAEVYFIDMTKLLNESKAGKEAQQFLKKKFNSESKKFGAQLEKLKKEESELIKKKKDMSQEDYKKAINTLREKNKSYRQKRQEASNNFVNQKNQARATLLKTLNPIIEKYMQEKDIKMIVDKKNIVMASSNVDLTQIILKNLDKELKSINLK
tara:strand:+ start:58 stop:579 length:522 start_codon:yes stop_codon:yes gene_type:complete